MRVMGICCFLLALAPRPKTMIALVLDDHPVHDISPGLEREAVAADDLQIARRHQGRRDAHLVEKEKCGAWGSMPCLTSISGTTGLEISSIELCISPVVVQADMGPGQNESGHDDGIPRRR